MDDENELIFIGPDGDGWGYSLTLESIERYGLSWGEYHAILDAQERRCAICDRPHAIAGPLVVDHDHDSGKVRGLLCHECNLGLGKFRDRPDLLAEASDYLWTHGCEATRLMREAPKDLGETSEQRARRLAHLPLRTITLELAYHAPKDEPGLGNVGDEFHAFGRRWQISEKIEDDPPRLRCREMSYGYELRSRRS